MLSIVLTILSTLAFSQACPARASAGNLPAGDVCDPEARANSWTPAQKRETRRRVWAACKRVGGSDLYCHFWDAAVRRESSGVASRVHVLGADRDGRPEYGLGPLGLSVRWHSGKWPGDPDPDFCVPEVAFVVGHAIVEDAVSVYGATDARGLQAIFGNGRHAYSKIEHGAPRWWLGIPVLAWIAERLPARTEYRVTPQPRHERAVCSRMGFDAETGRRRCYMRITAEDLGRRVPLSERRAWAVAAAQASS